MSSGYCITQDGKPTRAIDLGAGPMPNDVERCKALAFVRAFGRSDAPEYLTALAKLLAQHREDCSAPSITTRQL